MKKVKVKMFCVTSFGSLTHQDELNKFSENELNKFLEELDYDQIEDIKMSTTQGHNCAVTTTVLILYTKKE